MRLWTRLDRPIEPEHSKGGSENGMSDKCTAGSAARGDTPTICNAIEGFGVRAKTTGYTDTSLRLRVSMEDKPMVGYARTGIISARYPADTQ